MIREFRILSITVTVISVLWWLTGSAHAEETTVDQRTHSLWVTPGQLVEFRIDESQLNGLEVGDDLSSTDAPAIFVLEQGVPDSVELLENADGSRTLFWVPGSADTGSWSMQVSLHEAMQGELLGQWQINIEVLASFNDQVQPLAEADLDQQSDDAIDPNAGDGELVTVGNADQENSDLEITGDTNVLELILSGTGGG